jgi:hypothetical protein
LPADVLLAPGTDDDERGKGIIRDCALHGFAFPRNLWFHSLSPSSWAVLGYCAYVSETIRAGQGASPDSVAPPGGTCARSALPRGILAIIGHTQKINAHSMLCPIGLCHLLCLSNTVVAVHYDLYGSTRACNQVISRIHARCLSSLSMAAITCYQDRRKAVGCLACSLEKTCKFLANCLQSIRRL